MALDEPVGRAATSLAKPVERVASLVGGAWLDEALDHKKKNNYIEHSGIAINTV